MSAGLTHTCATRTDGTAWCWGANTQGELGDGTTTQRLVTVRVGTATNWTSISAGSTHSCGLRGNGVAWCWGSESFGKLGNGKHGKKSTDHPVQVQTTRRWIMLDAGDEHTCAVPASLSAWCWGSNISGQLGIGSIGRRNGRDTPTRVGAYSDWTTVIAGYETTCGIRAGGSAWCWGDNSSGQLGDGTKTTRTVPTQVVANTNWTSIRPGGSHTCGTRAGATAWCWGSNDHGQLGDGSMSASAVPVRIGAATSWMIVSAGGTIYKNHTCALRASGTAWCWGDNLSGQLGDGTNVDRLTPAQLY